MLDLETLGTKPGSVILSIGAVKFNRKEVLPGWFHFHVSPADSRYHGLQIEGDTVLWWLTQSDEARKAITESKKYSLPYVLNEFTKWLEHDCLEIWGNGANFDNALLSAAYDACGLERPWKFWNDRCYRTVKALHPDLPLAKRTGTHHNAVDDARSQAEHLITLPSFQAMCEVEEAQFQRDLDHISTIP